MFDYIYIYIYIYTHMNGDCDKCSADQGCGQSKCGQCKYMCLGLT